MTIDEALSFVREHGAVLAAAAGPLPRLSEAIAGEPIRGSWWAHPQGRRIFAVLHALAESPDLLVCRLAGGKVTYVHRRLWPALVRAAHRFDRGRLAQVHEEHTAAGRHAAREIPFPRWVPDDDAEAARRLGEAEALDLLGPLLAGLAGYGERATRRRAAAGRVT